MATWLYVATASFSVPRIRFVLWSCVEGTKPLGPVLAMALAPWAGENGSDFSFEFGYLCSLVLKDPEPLASFLREDVALAVPLPWYLRTDVLRLLGVRAPRRLPDFSWGLIDFFSPDA